ncbi:2-polyprenyl-6-methoxyphenol hydroxylase-like FAD-dependent oxidoreductase [Streptomyces sp. V3I8]|uniref:FAD-dependent oxidoreductase n=1 Tax=Streptomyces sp. V3I8 TaxID=3042279 RepID=UPI002785BA3E|nr:FAD-dependent monooxygenase [Streptomyces sp. V3I8]MDQ1041668.1 2-polyprenyl-6-methoxyphenol hydroxylase-like FAD-dependent oxidoreductase [Streptomyces sp. V3I8]
MTRRDPGQRLRVLVIGAGIGGLSLAQGLRREGIDVAVHERDAHVPGSADRYRLRITPEGDEALRACLPNHLHELLVATSMTYDKGIAGFDEHLSPVWEMNEPDVAEDRRVDAVDRAALRAILFTGLEDTVVLDSSFERLEQTQDGRVRAYFANGTTDTGDVLVAADGVDSAVRARCRPGDEDRPRDLKVRSIVSRVPREAVVKSGLPDFLQDRFSAVTACDGVSFGLLPMTFRTSRPPGAPVAVDTEDYYTTVLNLHRDALDVSDEAFFAMTGEQLLALLRARTAGWHPDLRALLDHAAAPDTHPIALRAAVPVRPWEPGRVIPLGDAVHAMPPSGGVGANTAVQDAALLCRELGKVDRRAQTVTEAARAYGTAMASYAAAAVTMSLQMAKGSTDIDWSP